MLRCYVKIEKSRKKIFYVFCCMAARPPDKLIIFKNWNKKQHRYVKIRKNIKADKKQSDCHECYILKYASKKESVNNSS